MLLASLTWAFPTPAQAAPVAEPQEIKVEVNQEPYGPVPQTPIQPSPAPKPKAPPKAVQVLPKSEPAKPKLKEPSGNIQVSMKAKVVAKWGEDEWPAMHYILDHESGSNPYAVNPRSGACGIPQALPCSKLLKVIGSLDNVDGQLDWMVGYVASRYGTPTKARAFHLTHNWY
jgi:outer membrane biosynthesis protein TonB